MNALLQKTPFSFGKIRINRFPDTQERLMNIFPVYRAGFYTPVLCDKFNMIQSQPQSRAHSCLFSYRCQSGIIVDCLLHTADSKFRSVMVHDQPSGFTHPFYVCLIDRPILLRFLCGSLLSAIRAECRSLHDLASAFNTLHTNISPLFRLVLFFHSFRRYSFQSPASNCSLAASNRL